MVVPNLTIENVYYDPNICNHRPKGTIISAIVLHATAGTDSLAYLSHFHNNPVSVHRLVPKQMKDGNPGFYQIVPDALRAWHAGLSDWGGRQDWNDFSIGIEIENLNNGHDPYSDQQYETVAQSVAYLCALWDISRRWVRLHREISGRLEGKTDPDRTWDMDRMWTRVTEIECKPGPQPIGWPYNIPYQRAWITEVPNG